MICNRTKTFTKRALEQIGKVQILFVSHKKCLQEYT